MALVSTPWVHWVLWLQFWSSPAHASLRLSRETIFWGEELQARPDDSPEVTSQLADTVASFSGSAVNWKADLAPWTQLVESLVTISGRERWRHYELACLASSIQSSSQRGSASSLFDTSVPVTLRARSARLGRHSASWWLEQLKGQLDREQQMFWVLMVASWSTTKSFGALIDPVEAMLQGLSVAEYASVRAAAERQRRSARDRQSATARLELVPAPSARMTGLFFDVVDVTSSQLDLLESSGDPILRTLASRKRSVRAMQDARPFTRNWEAPLAILKEEYGKHGSHGSFRSFVQNGHLAQMPLQAAKTVLDEPLCYPEQLVSQAQAIWGKQLKVRPISEIAAEEGWTFQ